MWLYWIKASHFRCTITIKSTNCFIWNCSPFFSYNKTSEPSRAVFFLQMTPFLMHQKRKKQYLKYNFHFVAKFIADFRIAIQNAIVKNMFSFAKSYEWFSNTFRTQSIKHKTSCQLDKFFGSILSIE